MKVLMQVNGDSQENAYDFFFLIFFGGESIFIKSSPCQPVKSLGVGEGEWEGWKDDGVGREGRERGPSASAQPEAYLKFRLRK